MITYHQLRTFLAVARTGSLTRAARELSASQPTVSLQLRALRKSLGTTLLERSGNRLQLTAAGEMLRRYAEETLGGRRILEQDIAALKGSPSGGLTLGATFILSYLLPSVSARFRAQFPGVVLQLHVDSPEELFEHLLAGTLDVACYIYLRTPSGLTVEAVGEEEFVIIASPQHPLARRRHVKPEELSGQPLVVPRVGLFRESLEDKLRTLGVSPGAATEVRNYDAVATMVKQNAGYALHVKRSVTADLAAGKLVVLHLEGPPILTQIVAAYRSRPTAPPLIQEIIPFLRAELRDALGPTPSVRARRG